MKFSFLSHRHHYELEIFDVRIRDEAGVVSVSQNSEKPWLFYSSLKKYTFIYLTRLGRTLSAISKYMLDFQVGAL